MENSLKALPLGRRLWLVRTGFTLLELVTAITLMGLTLAGAVPTARRLVDRMAVVGAREEVMGLFHQVRLEALARGGSTLLLEASPPTARIWSGSALRASTDLEASYGVDLTLSRNRERVELSFDALGLGRVSSQTLRISRGREVATLVVSSTGRVTRR